jgi:hypothetical protein
MPKMKLPVLPRRVPGPKKLSMDEYLAFVMWNLEFAVDKAARRNEHPAKVLFSLN